MRRIASFIFLCILSWRAVAQNPTTLDGWAQRLKLFGEKVQQEEVFLHMDNSCYYLGDTLYYKAYMRLSDGRPSPLSRLLYVELLNQDGYLVERQRVEMTNGQGHGSFVLLDTLYGGYYELRAYTRWQLNWGCTEHPHTRNAERWFFSRKMAHAYYRDYEKLYSRVFPVYDKPHEAGGYFQDMTTRPLQRVFKQKEEKPKAVVRFYPEGGNLVAGVPNRVAFEANDENGKHLKGKLRIKNEEFGIDIDAETVSRGRGMFMLDLSNISADGTGQKCTFTWDGGSQTFNLPKVVEDGVAIQASMGEDGVHVRLHPHGRTAQEPLGLTASCHGVQKDFQTIDINAHEDVVIPLSKLPTGVIQLTVFNAEGRIYADRLVFVRQPGFQPQNITFAGVKGQYEPYEEVNLTLALSNREGTITSPSEGQGGGVSLAVRDAAHSDYTFDSGNILTEMLLASQVRGFVEQPEYFFEADDEEHRRALDLLLLVQGWRRYGWHEMATPGAFSITQPYERTEILMGEVNTYFTEEQENVFVEAMREFMAKEESNRESLENPFEESEDTGTGMVSPDIGAEIGALNEEMIKSAETRQGTQYKTNSEETENRWSDRYKDGGTLKEEAMVYAEFSQPGAKQGESMVVGEMNTYNHGAFKIEAPKFFDVCLFFYSAIRPKDYKGESHIWRMVNEDSKGNLNYPYYYAKLNTIYPRFVKPYNFYQKTLPASRLKSGRRMYVDDDAILMEEVTIGARRSGLRRFDASKPAYVVDAYVAFNDACDAGLCPGYFIGSHRFINDVARTYIGDMNMERAYRIEPRWNTKNSTAFISDAIKEKYNHLPNLDMVYIYTDYSPRNEGDKRFTQDNQPTVTVDLRCFEDGGQRMTYRDRFMCLTGYAVCEEFYQPDYSKQKPTTPTDYRRTLYWNPDVKLDAEGRATLHFYNNSQKTQFVISAEGMTSTGKPLTGISYPEDRE